MNLGASAIVLRPRGVAEIMDLACRFTFTRAFGLYLRLSAVFLLPFYAGVVALHYLLELEWWHTWLIAIALATWLEAPFTLAASRAMFNEQPKTMQVVKSFGSNLASYTGAMIIKGLLVSITGVLTCGLGLFIIAPGGTYVPEVTLLEGSSASAAWGRSKRLVGQRSSDAFMAFASLFIAQLAFAFGFEVFGQALVSDILQLGKPFGGVFDEGVTPFCLAGIFLAAPYVATSRFLAYIDTRTRADGWDIQVTFMSVVAKDQAAKAGISA
jgi:hypothetical protein